PLFLLTHSSPLFPYTTLFRSGALLPRRLSDHPAGRRPDAPRRPRRRSAGDTALRGGGAWRLAAVPSCPAPPVHRARLARHGLAADRKSTRLNSSHRTISYAVF